MQSFSYFTQLIISGDTIHVVTFFMPCPQYDVTSHLICISLEPLLILKGLSSFWFSFYRRFKKKDTLILTQENFLKPGRG